MASFQTFFSLSQPKSGLRFGPSIYTPKRFLHSPSSLAFLNSWLALPNERASSGIRLAPKSKTTTTEQYSSNLGCLCGAQIVLPNNFDLCKMWWPWNTAGTLKGRIPWRTTKPAQCLGMSWFWHGGDLCWSYKTRIFRLLLARDRVHFTMQCCCIFFLKLSFLHQPIISYF